jgi:hypothetical protein
VKTFNVLLKKKEIDSVGVWSKCGVMWQKDTGEMAIRLDVIPDDPGWDGWLALSKRPSDDYTDGLIALSAFEEPPF